MLGRRATHLSGVVLLAVLAIPIRSAAQQPADVDRLAFMAGCWELRTPTRVTHEQWMAPLGGMMVGMSRTVVDGVALEWEALRVELREERVTYSAQPGGQTPTHFAATEITDSGVVFANRAHDFPQRIIYRSLGTDSLVARIEGEIDGAPRGMDFPFSRVSCHS